MIYTIVNDDEASELKIFSGTDKNEDVLRIIAINNENEGITFNEVEYSLTLKEAIQLRDSLTSIITTSHILNH